MIDYNKRLIQISEFLKTTSFFWEKELLNQDLTQLPTAFFEKAQNFQELDLEDKAHWANHGQDSIIKELIHFKSFVDSYPHKPALYVKEKKAHEFSRILAYLEPFPPNKLIDLCGGIGHLPMALRGINPELESLTLDYDLQLVEKGRKLNSAEKRQRYNTVDLREEASIDQTELLIGLHTCGDLAEHTINHFIKSKSQNLLNWGCCYHKTSHWSPLSSIGKNHLPAFDKFALTLAAKCYKQLSSDEVKRRYRVKKYRYALELFINNKDEFKTGSFHPKAYQGSFKDYIEHANRELTLNISTEGSEEFFQNNIKKIEELIALGFYRDHWGRVIESAIILDRALYLQEQGYHIEIIETFDRQYSPRNLALTAKL